MKSSTVSFAPAPPAPGASVPAGRSVGAFDSDTADERMLERLAVDYDAELRMLADDERAIAALEAVRTRRLARLASLADRLALADGSAATAAGREWARRRLSAEIGCALHRPEPTVTRLVNEAEELTESLPATLDALASGDISYAHARRMVSHAVTLPAESRAAFETALLPAACTLTAARFDDRARRTRESLHPESITVRTRAALAERFVSLSPEVDGMATLVHHLPAVDALGIDDLIDRVARSQRADDDPRTHAQRRCDALTDLVLGRGDRPRITPTVLVTVAATTLAGRDSQPADLHGYGPLDPHLARALAALAPTHLRATLDPATGTPLTVTRHRRPPVPHPPAPAWSATNPPSPCRTATHSLTPAHAPARHRSATNPVARGPLASCPLVADRSATHLRMPARSVTNPAAPGPLAFHQASPDRSATHPRMLDGSAAHPRMLDGAASPPPPPRLLERGRPTWHPPAPCPRGPHDPTSGPTPATHDADHGAGLERPDRYSAPAILRTVLMLADETCRFPGCGRRASRCELDHTRDWALGGRTVAANLAHLCPRHHHLKHDGGWRVTASHDGTRTLTWTSPRGAQYTTAPAGLAPPSAAALPTSPAPLSDDPPPF